MKMEDLFRDAININEAFDTRFDSIGWEHSYGNHLAEAILNGEKFLLYVEESTFTVDGKLKNFLNIAFARVVDGKVTQDLLNTKTSQSKQLGAVVSALREKIDELSKAQEIDAITFMVVSGEEKRIPFYMRILMSKIYGLRPWQYRFSVKWFGGTALVATKELLGPERKNALEQEILHRRKQISFHFSE